MALLAVGLVLLCLASMVTHCLGTFRALTWNILADGLSDDGFIMPLVGRSSSELPKRHDSEWDEQAKTDGGLISLPLKTGPLAGSVESDGTLAEMIQDVVVLKQAVLTRILQEMEASPSYSGCYSLKEQGKAFGWCNQDALDQLAVYKGHECRDRHGEELTSGTFASTGDFQDPPEVNMTQIYRTGNGALPSSLSGFAKCRRALAVSDTWKCTASKSLDDVDRFAPLDTAMQKYLVAVERFNRKWGLRLHIKNARNMLDWGQSALEEETGTTPDKDGRGMVLVRYVLDKKPDIVAMQELDHYGFMVKELGKAHFASSLETPTAYSLRDKCTDREASQEFAYMPKCKSKAKVIHVNGDPSKNDDDGSALFWNTKRFEAQRIIKVPYGEGTFGVPPSLQRSSGGFVGVLLKDLDAEQAGKSRWLWAFATHLASGAGPTDEAERVWQIGRIHAEAHWDELRQELVDSGNATSVDEVGVLLLMDGNSYEVYSEGDFNKDTNMYSNVKKKLGLANYQVSEPDEGAGHGYTADVITASVNRYRGPASGQPSKSGQHELNRIDYVAHNDALLQRSTPELPRYSRKEPADAYNNVLPNEVIRSDHLPVVLDLGFKLDGEAGPGAPGSSDFSPFALVLASVLASLLVGFVVMACCRSAGPGAKRASTASGSASEPFNVELPPVRA